MTTEEMERRIAALSKELAKHGVTRDTLAQACITLREGIKRLKEAG